MHDRLKLFSRIALLMALVVALAPDAGAQKEPKQRPQTPASQKVPTEGQSRDALSPDAEAEQAAQRAQFDRDLMRMREQVEREAMSRMRFDRPDALNRFMNQIGPFLAFLVILGALLWILRVVLENRRWYRVVKVQTEMHAKLLDRFGSGQDMLAYMESAAGKRFLESPAFDIQPGQSAIFPYARILWSAQVGLIVAALGVGLLFLRGKVPTEGDAPLLVFGTVALTLGLGFLLSAAASYLLSRRFGLLEHKAADAAGSASSAPRR